MLNFGLGELLLVLLLAFVFLEPKHVVRASTRCGQAIRRFQKEWQKLSE